MAHTPGPWCWRINRSCKRVYLNGRGGTVMDFVRYGTSSAAPRFQDHERLMARADEFAANLPGYDHHSDWDQSISHADAILIESAPELLSALKQIEAIVESKIPDVRSAVAAVTKDAIARAQIAPPAKWCAKQDECANAPYVNAGCGPCDSCHSLSNMTPKQAPA